MYKLTGILNDIKNNHIIVGFDNETETKLNTLKKRMLPKNPQPDIRYNNPMYIKTVKVNFKKNHLIDFDKMAGEKITVWCKVRKYCFSSRPDDKDSPKIAGWLLNLTEIALQ